MGEVTSGFPPHSLKMKRPKEIKIAYKYVGDESPEKKKEAVDEFFDMIFDKMLEDKRKNREKKLNSFMWFPICIAFQKMPRE